MVDSATAFPWAALRTSRPMADDALVTVGVTVRGQVTDLKAGIDQAGHLHLLLPVEGGPTGAKPNDLAGLRVRHRVFENGQFLDLVASPAHERVFTPERNDWLHLALRSEKTCFAKMLLGTSAYRRTCNPRVGAKTPVNKYRFLRCRKDDVWRARQIASVKPETEAQPMDQTSDSKLRFCILGLNSGHILAASLRGKFVQLLYSDIAHRPYKRR